MMRVVQKIRVVASETEGCAIVIQGMPFEMGEYQYEVLIESVEEFVNKLDRMFKDNIKNVLDRLNDKTIEESERLNEDGK